MINVTRGQRPTSLDRAEIREYLEKVAAYNLLDETEKDKIKQPNAGDYRNNDVLDAFDRDFHSKCYLTEEKFPNSYSMEVEHFKSKAFGQSPELKYEWSNLYPCSHEANSLKPKKDPESGYLDPCDENDNVEKDIIYDLHCDGVACFGVRDETNLKAKNTVKLLDKVHNGIDYPSEQKTKKLRHLIAKRERELLLLIIAWSHENNLEEKFKLGNRIKFILSRKSDFTMLLRSLSCVQQYLPADFLD